MKKINRYKLLPFIAIAMIVIVIVGLHYINTKNIPSGSAVDSQNNSAINKDSSNNVSSDSISEDNSDSADGDSDSGAISNPDGPDSPHDNLSTDTYGDITIAFTGDILLADNLYAAYQSTGLSGFLSDKVSSTLKNADLTFINEEFPFSNRGTPEPGKEYTYCVPPERVQVFKDMGVDMVSLSNNHILDYGQDALADTFEVLDSAGIEYVGAGANLDRAKQPIIREIKGRRIAFLAASRVVPSYSWYAQNADRAHAGVFTTYDSTELCAEIAKAKTACDIVIVYAHWGVERQETASDYQRILARNYIDAGADLVIGSHAHVMQGVEFYKDVPIVYGMGNFLFSNYYSRTTVVTCTIDSENKCNIEFLPCKSQSYYTQDMTEEEIPGFYDFLNSVSFGVNFNYDGTFNYVNYDSN